MDLAQALANHAPKKQECKLLRILNQLSEKERETFWEYANTEGMSARRLADGLSEYLANSDLNESSISDDAIDRHINWVLGRTSSKTCCCSKTGSDS